MDLNLRFKITVNNKGFHSIQCDIHPPKYVSIGSILWVFPNIPELNWFKKEVINAKEMEVRTYTGLNTFECYVTNEFCELGHSFDHDDFDTVPTQVVLDFIDEAIKFHEHYNSGGIPGIIPASKKEEWVIVPKEYVKEEYLKTIRSDEK